MKQKYSLGENVTAPTSGSELRSPNAGVLSAFLGGECEEDVWYLVRDVEGYEAEFPEDALRSAVPHDNRLSDRPQETPWCW